MKKVFISAPLAGDIPGNIERAKEYAAFALKCGVAPVTPHFLALILDDNDPKQREIGLKAGLAYIWFVDEVWCFGGRVSPGMKAEMKLARALNIKVRYFNRGKDFGFYETKKGVHS